MANPAPSTSPSPEYQHFVPQFMLKNFAHKYTGPQRTKKGKKNKGDSLYRGELVVNNVNLKIDPIAIEETKVSRILGRYDMYQDTTQPAAQQRQIETMLGKLESYVSIIFRRIVKAFEAGDPGVWVTREERNSIRKFLFVLKYRGSTFHRRFHHETSDEYEANDKSRMQAYMKENNFKRPVDVWFHGLKTIMNLNMDTDNWQQELVKNMYRDDAMWFIMHTEMMYMAFCTPSEPGDEFILTDNSYNVFEGPNTFVQNPITGEYTESGWANLHEFAPISPKLMIVLRSNLLPIPEEDSSPRIREWRETMRKAAIDDAFGTSQPSRLADLPIKKARNNYSQVVNNQIELLPGEDGAQRKTHKFCFSFFPVGTEHVDKINCVFFENAYRCASIVFSSRDAFVRTLEWYMTTSTPLAKRTAGDSQEARHQLLLALAALLKSLGSTREPVWSEDPAHVMSDFDRMRALQRMLQSGIADLMLEAEKESRPRPQQQQPSLPSDSAYSALGGTMQTIIDDMEYSRDMLDRRIKIDVKSKNLPEHIRGQRREQLIEEYLTYPSRRVLLFVRRVRYTALVHHDGGSTERANKSLADTPEDPVAHALHDMMTAEKINRLMYKTAMNDIDRETDPASVLKDDLWMTPIPSPEGVLRLRMTRKFVFDLPGLLKECGIPKIERLALDQEQRIRQHGLGRVRGLPYPFIDDDLKLELLTRIMARPKFRETLAGSVEAGLLQELENVFFGTAYPTPPMVSPI